MRSKTKKYFVTGLGFGDEGKGTAVDYISRTMDNPVVIRMTGGPQAAHNVVLPDGRSHTFSQFGSGLFAGAKSIYCAKVMNPIAALSEADHLVDLGINPESNSVFSDSSLIATPYQIATNKIKEELRGAARHGSCGHGINETVNDYYYGVRGFKHNLSLKFIENKDLFIAKLREVRLAQLDKLSDFIEDPFSVSKDVRYHLDFLTTEGTEEAVYEKYAEFYKRFQVIAEERVRDHIFLSEEKIYEGAQGVLLDPKFGVMFPFVTRLSPLEFRDHFDPEDPNSEHVLVTRTYESRHGAGPMPSESSMVTGYDPHNSPNKWQSSMRYGYKDVYLFSRALLILKKNNLLGKNNSLFVTHADIMKSGNLSGRWNMSPELSNIMSSIDLSDMRGLAPKKVLSLIDIKSDIFYSPDIPGELGAMACLFDVNLKYISYGKTWKDKSVVS